MKSIREWVLVGAAIAVASGCGGEYISNTMGGVNFSRNNGVVTVTIPGSSITVGSAQSGQEKRNAEGYHGVAVDHGIEVVIEEGDAGELTVEADDNLLPLIETKVENGILQVRVVESLETSNPIRVQAAARGLSDAVATCSSSIAVDELRGDRVRIETHSGGRVMVDDVKGEAIALSATSAGRVTAQHVEGRRLDVNVSSAGGVEATGEVDEQKVQTSSSGTFAGAELKSRLARVDASSSGSAAVQATEEVTGSASSSGSVRYFGNPAKVSVETSSAGSASAG